VYSARYMRRGCVLLVSCLFPLYALFNIITRLLIGLVFFQFLILILFVAFVFVAYSFSLELAKESCEFGIYFVSRRVSSLIEYDLSSDGLATSELGFIVLYTVATRKLYRRLTLKDNEAFSVSICLQKFEEMMCILELQFDYENF